MFEILKTDLSGRIGVLHTNHGKVETPAYVPVIHPVKQTISAKKIRDIGFDLVITNAYITRNSYGNEAVDRGIHDIINFDGAIMTDSGGYQVLEYGGVKVSAQEMADFETKIKADFAIPLDKPTGFGLPKKKAKSYVEHTLKISKQTLQHRKSNGQIWLGPIQGGEHDELVRRSTKSLLDYGFQMLALGSPVEFMVSYEYRLLAKMIINAKKQMPPSVPLHLFGAGHPLTIPFAIALGCDTFDSASYMLYAKQQRYITEDRTRHLSEISYFSCNCEVCSKFTPKELVSMNSEEKINKIALHNLFAIKSEVDRVKESILEGRLWEYVMKKLRAHPKLYEVKEVFVNNSEDVQELQGLLIEKNSSAGIILKIETQKGFDNLPDILLTAMKYYPVGVMIARGDLAIETGWKNFATIQQEIMRICGAAHLPDIWATQVLRDHILKRYKPNDPKYTINVFSDNINYGLTTIRITG